MIKIIKNGRIPKPTKRIYEATCEYCGCKFEFEIEDIKSQERRLDGCITVECPCCRKDITQALFKYRLQEVEE